MGKSEDEVIQAGTMAEKEAGLHDTLKWHKRLPSRLVGHWPGDGGMIFHFNHD